VDQAKNFILIFTSILYEAMPFILLGAIIAGILEELVPQQFMDRVIPKNRFLAIALAALLGLIFPMCECGIVPVMRRLLRKGLPLSCCTAYLLAGPVINVVVILATAVAFSGQDRPENMAVAGYQMGSLWAVVLRVGLTYVIAVSTSLLVEWMARKYGVENLVVPLANPAAAAAAAAGNGPAKRKTAFQRLSSISETALHDFVDITVFLILGAILAATVRIFVTQEMIAEWSSQYIGLTILMMMGLAILLCLCSEADAFVAASFSTMRPAAKMAFLVLGPMLDIKLILMYHRVFRPRLIYTIFGAVLVQVFLYSLLTHVLWETYAPVLMGPITSTP
jgi:uncharacterized membrane protein YraQ (UPF0718 family)